MDKNISPVFDLWKKEMSDHIKKYVPYHASNQLKQIAALFSPGLFYYYILNFHNLSMDYVHPGTKEVLGVEPEGFNMEVLLKMLPPEELKALEKKEALVADFLFRFLSPEEMLFYKVVYFFRVRDTKGTYHNMLHQATTLTVSDSGRVEHVLGIQTDISHLGILKNDKVSFISLRGDKSYFNIDPEKGGFDPANSNVDTPKLSDILTKRELEITKLVAMGLNSEKIAEELIVSLHTIRTHRKNIMRKANCSNTVDLVAKCLIEGLI